MKKNYLLRQSFIVCVLIISTQATVFGTAKTWKTTGTTNWATSSNWTPAGVPASSDDVTIPSGTTQPIITNGTTAACGNLTINSGATLEVATNTSGVLDIYGSITNNGTLNHSGNLLIYLKGTNKTIGGTGTYLVAGLYLNGTDVSYKLLNNTAIYEMFIDPTDTLNLNNLQLTASNVFSRMA